MSFDPIYQRQYQIWYQMAISRVERSAVSRLLLNTVRKRFIGRFDNRLC